MPTTIPITLPRPHRKEDEIIKSPAKRKIIVAGRRVGKTTTVAMIASKALLKRRRVLYAAPKQDQTGAFWGYCKGYFADATAAGYIYKNETQCLLEWQGGCLRAKTAWDADGLRSDYADLLILDEYALMDPDTWDEVGAPMLLDNNGDAIFVFTPKRRNHAFHLYQRAKADTTGRWQAWNFSSHDNPYLSAEALAEITAEMTEDAYRQEILAEFLENEGAVFRNIEACMHAPASTLVEHEGHYIVAGVDWGKQNDFTAISIGCATCHQELELDRFNQIDYVFQRGRLEVLCEKWHVGWAMAESNAMGEPVIEELQRVGLPVEGFQTTATSKPPLIENLALALEREEWQFLNDSIAKGELEAYERKVSVTTGRSSYSAPEGLHDDTVIARALMLRAAGDGGPAIIEIG